MSEQLTTYAEGIQAQYPVVSDHVDALRDQTRRTVREAAALGAMIEQANVRNAQHLWQWLGELIPSVREDVIAISMRANRYQQKHPELEDPAQLAFALAVPVEKEDGGDGAPTAREGGAAAAVFQAGQNWRAKAVKLVAITPPAQWSPLTKQKWRDMLKPLVEIYREIEGK